MIKRTYFQILTIAVFALFWLWAKSHTETRTTAASSTSPADRPTAASPPSPPPQSENPEEKDKDWEVRKAAFEDFERKRRASGGPEMVPRPMAAYDWLPMTGDLQVNQRTFRVVSARAVQREHYSPSMGPIIYQNGGFAIVPINDGGDKWKALVMHGQARPVLINPANGRLAIVTGTMVVKVKDMAAAQQLARREHLEIISKDESINTVYFRAPANYALLEGQSRLLKQPNVERVELELFQNRKEPR